MFLTSTRKTDLPQCHEFFQRLLPPSAQALTPCAVKDPFSNLSTNPTDLSTLPPPLSADAHDDASRPLNGYLLPVPLHALLDNTRQRVSSHHGLLRMLRQLRLGDWDYSHLVALCILTRHVCVGGHTVTAAAHRVIATLLHAAHILALCFCAATRPPIYATSVSRELTPQNTVDRPAAGRESSRHQTSLAVSCLVQRAPLFDDPDRCSMAFASAYVLSFLGLYKRYCAIASFHCVMVLQSFGCLLSLQPMPLHAINPSLAAPPLTSPPATHLCSEAAAQTNAMDSHTANRTPHADTATPEGNNPCRRAQASGPQQFSVSPTGDSLSHASLKVGGPEITPNRLSHLLS